MKFSDLGLNDALVSSCESNNFTEPTPIQNKAIPVILTGSDLIGCAETGTGKTAAFLLPVIQRITHKFKPGVRVLVVAPTRELVSQIEQSFIELAPKNLKSVSLIGGASVVRQTQALKRGASVIIATPGRLVDHIERGTVNVANIDVLILDEADRMLDMGFLPAIRKILGFLPVNRQTLLFSATISDGVKNMARTMMHDPKIVEVSRQNVTAQTVQQIAYPIAAASKTAFLINLLEDNKYDRVIVFTRTRRGAERLAHILEAREMQANRIHADRSQSQRETALRDFRSGKTRVLVATDIASRGIDIDSVSHVINYDVPESPEDYVHRVGRTGRAGNEGQAITLVSPIEEIAMRDIEKLTSQKVKRVEVPEFGELKYAPAAVGRVFPKPASAGGFRKPNFSGGYRSRRAGR